jgi:8-amino-7-oxononanoate synthase
MWDDLNESLRGLRRRGRFRELNPRRIEGVRLIDAGGASLINFGSNDYLGLSSFVAARMRQADTPETSAHGATASGLVCGWTDRHQVLSEKISRFEQTAAAVVFPSGFAACSGTIATLCRTGDLILSDRLNHASLIDGCRLSKARRIVYPHRDVGRVDQLLSEHRGAFDRAWIVTDSVFSMDGHVAPLRDLCDVADRHDATLIVDEAHATGILGDSASGACEAFGVKDRVPIRIGTLSKALGSQGGFVAGPRVIADYLVNYCRPYIFSTALSLPAVEAAILGLESDDEMLRRRDRVCAHARTVRRALGMDFESIESVIPIIPVEIGSDVDTLAASQRMREWGMFVPGIRPPTVPEGRARLRVSLSADHDDDMIDQLVMGLKSL